MRADERVPAEGVTMVPTPDRRGAGAGAGAGTGKKLQRSSSDWMTARLDGVTIRLDGARIAHARSRNSRAVHSVWQSARMAAFMLRRLSGVLARLALAAALRRRLVKRMWIGWVMLIRRGGPTVVRVVMQ